MGSTGEPRGRETIIVNVSESKLDFPSRSRITGIAMQKEKSDNVCLQDIDRPTICVFILTQ